MGLGIPPGNITFTRLSGTWPNTHKVPETVVQKMYEEMEDLSVETCLASKAPWEREKTPPEACPETPA